MALFALSCAGLLMFLWLSFGGTIPLNPQGYRIQVSFPNAGQLGTQADVRIAGVTIGKVVEKSLDPDGNRTVATLQIDHKFAPIHRDSHAILRQKTIIGETYVELSPGTPHSPTLPDGGMLPARPGAERRAARPMCSTRSTPRPAMRSRAGSRSSPRRWPATTMNLNNVLGNLPTFAASAERHPRGCSTSSTASVVRLLQNGGTTFAALGQNQSALRNLITSAEATFATTAANNAALAQTFHVFPTFLNESKLTFARLQSFALDTDPVIRELNPAIQQLGPTLRSVRALSPDLRRLFTNLGPLITASKTGLPAVRDVINGATPVLGALGPFLEQLNPILHWLSLHQQLDLRLHLPGRGRHLRADRTPRPTAAAAGSPAAACPCGHYLRQFSPLASPVGPTRDPNTARQHLPAAAVARRRPRLQRRRQVPGQLLAAVLGLHNTGGEHAATSSVQACWVGRPPGSVNGKIPEIKAATLLEEVARDAVRHAAASARPPAARPPAPPRAESVEHGRRRASGRPVIVSAAARRRRVPSAATQAGRAAR